MHRVREFRASDITDMTAQEPQLIELASCDLSEGFAHLEKLDSGTYLGAEGQPVLCAGVVPMSKHRVQAWALFSPAAGPHMTGILRAFSNRLDAYKKTRVEAFAQSGFLPAHRMLYILGFDCEAKNLRHFHGEDTYADMFVRYVT